MTTDVRAMNMRQTARELANARLAESEAKMPAFLKAYRPKATRAEAQTAKRKQMAVRDFRSSDPTAVDRQINLFYATMAGKEGFRVINVAYETVVFDTVAHVHYEVVM